MKPPFPYHGSKSRFATEIAGLIPPDHKCYVEPFTGSAAVLFSKEPSKVEVLNDADLALWSFLTALRDERDDLIAACLCTPYSRHEFMLARQSVDDPDISTLERARRFFTVISQGFGAVPNSKGWSSPETRTSEAVKVRRLISRFEDASARLADVHLECDTAARIMRRYDSPKTVQLVDPPYLWSTRSWASAQRSKQDYRVELQRTEDHLALLGQLRSLKSRVILCGRKSDLYLSELHDWQCHPLGNSDSEALWLNFGT